MASADAAAGQVKGNRSARSEEVRFALAEKLARRRQQSQGERRGLPLYRPFPAVGTLGSFP
ncbi:MAG TPA: hypothetical protein VJT16_07145 [Streptosporangiaceae bacterium]|jgi:hypothetical protein|nr:hypothetical protein [Streptosporangiaceae bacterium]